MKHELGIRIRVIAPPKGVKMLVQRGRHELVPPVNKTDGELVFEFPVEVDLSSGVPNFLGKYAQGPKDARFLYVNSGTAAGELGSPWSRRAKLSLMSITGKQVAEVLQSGSVLETSFAGIGRDGGPTCASVKGLVWSVEKK